MISKISGELASSIDVFFLLLKKPYYSFQNYIAEVSKSFQKITSIYIKKFLLGLPKTMLMKSYWNLSYSKNPTWKLSKLWPITKYSLSRLSRYHASSTVQIKFIIILLCSRKSSLYFRSLLHPISLPPW